MLLTHHSVSTEMKTVAILANTKRTFHNLNLEKQVKHFREGGRGKGRKRKEGGIKGEGRKRRKGGIEGEGTGGG